MCQSVAPMSAKIAAMNRKTSEPKKKPPRGLDYGKVDPEDFAFSLSLFSAASVRRMNVDSLTRVWNNPPPPGNWLVPSDIPLNRGAFAVLEHCGKDSTRFMRTMTRILAFMRISTHQRMSEWSKTAEDPEAIMFHPAVIETAACALLNSKADFDPAKFFAEVAKLASTSKYSESA